MTETIFEFLTKIGFLHPLHPAFTHIPMGMVMGAVVFRFCAIVPKFKGLAKTAYHCVILGLLGLIPTAFTGVLDWQHKYQGQLETLIVVKMVLASLLAILMLFIAVKDDTDKPGLNRMTGFYFLMIFLAVGLGFSGGELIFG